MVNLSNMSEGSTLLLQDKAQVNSDLTGESDLTLKISADPCITESKGQESDSVFIVDLS